MKVKVGVLSLEEVRMKQARRRSREDEGFKKKERMVRRRLASTSIQGLFGACRSVLKGPGTVPPPLGAGAIQILLDRMIPEDLGLSSDLMRQLQPRIHCDGAPRITCTTIYKCANFSMCIFFLPPSAVIPLHDHPGMTVFTKLLLGSMHVKSYDWAVDDLVQQKSSDDPATSPSSFRLAKMVVNSVIDSPCGTSVLYPSTGGNMHSFRAVTPCVVLDVLSPPYSNQDERDCTYYQDHPYSKFTTVASADVQEEEREQLAWLEAVDPPRDLNMVVVEYLGPPVVVAAAG